MNTTTEQDHARQLQEVTRSLFLGIVPERQDELTQYWTDFGPRFQILDDCGPDGSLIMDAGGFFIIRFNHRMMRLFWLASFLLWEGYTAQHQSVTTETLDLARFRQILNCFEATRAARDVDTVPWPADIPLPGVLVDHVAGDPARVGGELAIFSVGWALLHELRHLIHQQQQTSAPVGDEELSRQEELSCDAFATRFLLERVNEYAHAQGNEPAAVSEKRQMGIYCALYAITLLTKENWEDTATHPAMQSRIRNVLAIIESHGVSVTANVIAVAAFESLNAVYPNAPDPLSGEVVEIARRET